jgi:hypothetical protein
MIAFTLKLFILVFGLSSFSFAADQLISGRLVMIKAVMSPIKEVPQDGFLISAVADRGFAQKRGEAIVSIFGSLAGYEPIRPGDRLNMFFPAEELAGGVCEALQRQDLIVPSKSCDVAQVQNYGANQAVALAEISPRMLRGIKNDGVALDRVPESNVIRLKVGDLLDTGVIVAGITMDGLLLITPSGESQVLQVDPSRDVGIFTRAR